MIEKKCKGCEIVKPSDQFYAHKHGIGGLNPRCAQCCRERASKVYRVNNLEKIREADRNRYCDPDVKIKRREAHKDWLSRNREEQEKKWRQYYNDNREEILRKKKAWRQENRDMVYVRNADRRARSRRARLASADPKKMALFYREARRLTKETGIIHHVDHIIPLKGKNVCGLHVEWNMQILTGAENMSKKAKF